MEEQEIINVLQAKVDCKEIEVSHNGGSFEKSQSSFHTILRNILTGSIYRIKKEPEYVPFTFEDNKLFRNKWIRVKNCIPLTIIKCFGPKGLLNDPDNWISYEEAFNRFEFEDGTPFGKLKN